MNAAVTPHPRLDGQSDPDNTPRAIFDLDNACCVTIAAA